ncbi:MAG: DUF4142 domain-containing protein [Gemmatimonadaceae bacterium]
MSKISLALGATALITTFVASAESASAQAQPAASGSAAKMDDPTIVAIFDAANTWDMETGALAAKKSRNKDVRKFGRMLVHDHKGVRAQGRALAKKLNVHPTPPKDFALAADHKEAMRTLRRTRGPAFDRAFLDHEVSYHKAVIDAVTTTLLPATQNAELKDLETKVAPAFQAHMQGAQALLDKQPAAK